jgi:hypothetical protein
MGFDDVVRSPHPCRGRVSVSPLITVGLLRQSGEALTNVMENLEGVINRTSQRQQTFADVLATASLRCTGPADQVGLLHAGNGNHAFG